VTVDAMGCQRDIVKKIKEKEGDYVIAVKGHQKDLRENIQHYLDYEIDEKKAKNCDYYETIEKGHGRIEERRYYISDRIDWLPNKGLWTGLTTIGCVESCWTIKGKQAKERRYYICSIASDAKRFGPAVRSHWAVENNVHWVMDVIFNEDGALQASANAPENMASLRRLALNLLSLHKSQKSKKRKRVLAAMDNNFLQEIMFATD
jgi:predicted transposase YbfD/YdcC